MGYSLLGVLWERGWKTVGTKQGPTPNSRVNTLKNRPGGSCPCRAGKTLLCQGGEVVPITEEGAGKAHTSQAKPAGTWYGIGIEAMEQATTGEVPARQE